MGIVVVYNRRSLIAIWLGVIRPAAAGFTGGATTRVKNVGYEDLVRDLGYDSTFHRERIN